MASPDSQPGLALVRTVTVLEVGDLVGDGRCGVRLKGQGDDAIEAVVIVDEDTVRAFGAQLYRCDVRVAVTVPAGEGQRREWPAGDLIAAEDEEAWDERRRLTGYGFAAPSDAGSSGDADESQRAEAQSE